MPGAQGGTTAWVREQPCKGPAAGEGAGASWTLYESHPHSWGVPRVPRAGRPNPELGHLSGPGMEEGPRGRAGRAVPGGLRRWSHRERGVDARTERGPWAGQLKDPRVGTKCVEMPGRVRNKGEGLRLGGGGRSSGSFQARPLGGQGRKPASGA